MKKLGMVLFVLIIILVVAFLAKNIIVQNILSAGVKAFTGLELKTGSIDLGIPKTLISVQDLKLFNPPTFSDKIMLDMPEIYIDYDLGSLLKKKVHLEEIRINMKEFFVVKEKDGKLNLDSLKVVQAQKKPAEEQTKEKAQLPQIQIDKLRLTVGRVVFKDYSVGGAEPSVKEFNINLDEQMENITDPYTLSSIILVKVLSKTTIASLVNFDLGTLQKDVTEAAQKAAAAATETVSKAVEGVTETLGETTKSLTDTLKLPFGK